MIKEQFYPTYGNAMGCDYTNHYVRYLVDFATKGYKPYYIAYLDHDDVPEFMLISDYELSFQDGIGKLDYTIHKPDSNFNLSYAGVSYGNIQIVQGELIEQSTVTGVSVWQNTSLENDPRFGALNSFSYDVVYNQGLYFELTFIYRKGSSEQQYESCGSTKATWQTGDDFDKLWDWLNGKSTHSFTFTTPDGPLVKDISANDFTVEAPYRISVHESVGGVQYDGVIVISYFSRRNASVLSTAGRLAIQHGDETYYTASDFYPYPVNWGGRVECGFYIQKGIGHAVFENMGERPLSGVTKGGREFHFDETKHNTENTIYYSGNVVFYKVPQYVAYYAYVGWACWQTYSPKDIRFWLCSFPNYRTQNSIPYYPEIIDNKVTGNMFPQSELNEKGTDWQKNNDITSNTYTEDDLPPYSPDKDDPFATPNDPGKREEKIVGDVTSIGDSIRCTPSSGVNYFLLNANDIATLRTTLWSQTKDFYGALNIINSVGTDTIFNYVSSFRYYPVNTLYGRLEINEKAPVILGTGACLKLGDSDVEFYPINDITFWGYLGIWNLSSFPWRNNFLDYSPYSKLTITIPYCGEVELDINTIAAFKPIEEASIHLMSYTDIEQGSTVFIVGTSDATSTQIDQIIYSKQVKIAIDLPLSGNDQIAQSNAILQSTYKRDSTVLSTLTSTISEGANLAAKAATHTASVGDVGKFAANAAQGVMDIALTSAEASLAKRQVPVTIGDINGSFSTTLTRQYPYLTLYRQKTANPANYGHTTGFVCEASYTLSELAGFTVLSNPDLGMVNGATQEELEELMGILTSGFYV